MEQFFNRKSCWFASVQLFGEEGSNFQIIILLVVIFCSKLFSPLMHIPHQIFWDLRNQKTKGGIPLRAVLFHLVSTNGHCQRQDMDSPLTSSCPVMLMLVLDHCDTDVKYHTSKSCQFKATEVCIFLNWITLRNLELFRHGNKTCMQYSSSNLLSLTKQFNKISASV